MAFAIHKEIVIAAPVARVWRAITEQSELSHWYMRTDDFAPEVGCEFHFQDEPQGKWDGKITGEVLRADEPNVLEFTFWGNQMSYTTTVRYTLKDEGGSTRLTVDHTGFEGIGGALMRFIIQFGWGKFLKQLAASV